jgi:hypothetical protein
MILKILRIGIIFFIVPVYASNLDLNISSKQKAHSFIANSKLDGSLKFFMRNRVRSDVVNGINQPKMPNLDHGSLNLSLNFSSGYISKTIGMDVNLYSTFDMWQNESPDHEMNFWGVDNPYDKNPTSSSGCSGTWEKNCNQNGGQVQTAAIKLKSSEMLNAKIGYFQPSVPTAVGVNWSFSAGTYIGGQIGANFNQLELGLVVADEYRAPWFKESYGFRTSKGNDAGQIYSFGSKYRISKNNHIDIAYGALTRGKRINSHIKYKHKTHSGRVLSAQIYIVDDRELYSSTAYQIALLSFKKLGAYSLRTEATYTSAKLIDKSLVGNMPYRLTDTYAGSNGAYDIWWNNRSDFNHDGEIAIFSSFSRDMTDFGTPGLNIEVSGAFGAGAKSELTGIDELIEYSASGSLIYDIQKGPLKDSSIKVHYTYYKNLSNAGNWNPYTNAFQDETDLKISLTMPLIMN